MGETAVVFGAELSYREPRAEQCFHSASKAEAAVRFARAIVERTPGSALRVEQNWTRGLPYADLTLPMRCSDVRGVFRNLHIRPDAGVIEVNLPACDGFDVARRVIEAVHGAAEECGLLANIFRGGRNVGVGGGLHVTYAVHRKGILDRAATLRTGLAMLQVLRSTPPLSFLFCGDRDGPDGFHPRLDELYPDADERIRAMHSQLSQLAEQGDQLWPVVAEGLLSLMRDRNGQSHQVELCFDKIWSVDPTRSLGIVEMRMFEMFPSIEMLMAQLRFAVSFAAACSTMHGDLIQTTECENPDIGEFDAQRVLASLGLQGDADAWLPLARYRYPIVLELKIAQFDVRVRSARTHWFARHGAGPSDATVSTFVPRRVSLAVAIADTAGASCFVTVGAKLDEIFGFLASGSAPESADEVVQRSILNIVRRALDEIGADVPPISCRELSARLVMRLRQQRLYPFGLAIECRENFHLDANYFQGSSTSAIQGGTP